MSYTKGIRGRVTTECARSGTTRIFLQVWGNRHIGGDDGQVYRALARVRICHLQRTGAILRGGGRVRENGGNGDNLGS